MIIKVFIIHDKLGNEARHSRASGNPLQRLVNMDSRLRGNDEFRFEDCHDLQKHQ